MQQILSYTDATSTNIVRVEYNFVVRMFDAN